MKKIKQWFIGIVFSIWGGYHCLVAYGIFKTFTNMINLTGKDFIVNFILFILLLLVISVLPYTMFHAIKDGVKEELK